MRRLEVLVEEPSAEAALRHLLPKLVPVAVRWKIVNFRSKSKLLQELEARLRAYRARVEQGENVRILVLVDRDDDDCLVLKRRLAAFTARAGLSTRSRPDGDGRFRVVNRIVVEELESWFLGDPAALRAAFPSLPATNPASAPFRSPERGDWKTLHRYLRKHGIYRGRYPKIDAAKRIAPRMDVTANRSPSFRQFRAGLAALV